MSARSFLFVPGDRADMLAGARTRGADAIIADLEDAVAPAQKGVARETVSAWLRGLEAPGLEAWVRINPVPAESDLAIADPARITGLMVPKVRAAEELLELSGSLDRIETAAGAAAGTIRLLPIVETPQALRALDSIAGMSRVCQLMIGELDLGAELGVDPADADAFVPLRMEVVVASAAAGIEPPLGPVSPNYRNLDDFAADTRRLARMGFGSRPAIHPAQVPIINEAFTPSPEAVERAQRLVARYEAAHAAGKGAITDEDGQMVDEAVVRVARRLLRTARRGGLVP